MRIPTRRVRACPIRAIGNEKGTGEQRRTCREVSKRSDASPSERISRCVSEGASLAVLCSFIKLCLVSKLSEEDWSRWRRSTELWIRKRTRYGAMYTVTICHIYYINILRGKDALRFIFGSDKQTVKNKMLVYLKGELHVNGWHIWRYCYVHAWF